MITTEPALQPAHFFLFHSFAKSPGNSKTPFGRHYVDYLRFSARFCNQVGKRVLSGPFAETINI